jgi:hypothetical protein
MGIRRSNVSSALLSQLIIREAEEEYDRLSYRIFWDLAINHPEAGVAPIKCIEYYGESLRDVGMIRDGQKEVWFKDLVQDVFSQLLFLIFLVPSSSSRGASPRLKRRLGNIFDNRVHQPTSVSPLSSVSKYFTWNKVHSSSLAPH